MIDETGVATGMTGETIATATAIETSGVTEEIERMSTRHTQGILLDSQLHLRVVRRVTLPLAARMACTQVTQASLLQADTLVCHAATLAFRVAILVCRADTLLLVMAFRTACLRLDRLVFHQVRGSKMTAEVMSALEVAIGAARSLWVDCHSMQSKKTCARHLSAKGWLWTRSISPWIATRASRNATHSSTCETQARLDAPSD